jgi:hypothetical protein
MRLVVTSFHGGKSTFFWGIVIEKILSLPHKFRAMKKRTYKTKQQSHPVVQEPLSSYGIPCHPVELIDQGLPEGYMSLEQFGEIFHEKLDKNYENLQSNRQQ